MSTRAIAALSLLALASCDAAAPDSGFPDAKRDVAPIVSDRFSTEDARDRAGEAEEVMRLAGIQPGMSVADIGAGEGYYTVRLSPLVGAKGRVLAQDIVPETRDRLAQRVQREGLDNVTVRLGRPADPLLPPNSFDRIFMVHMYHEVTQPYEFLWHLRDGLKPHGLVIVVDADRPVRRHGMPPAELRCELAALGLEEVSFQPMEGLEAYFSAFRIAKPKPSAKDIKPCRDGKTA
ncbi:class I SAM-dependent methyltransferase [Sphingomonas jaspsi]|uniref:class I SAM-dependent methyltransferase n=1 Tax=Sphingomonas jaspsi TaxID=392409 RepID=UPI0004B92183|nr:methyltransferase domain-containing protein [Sphingomonas jaspsi]